MRNRIKNKICPDCDYKCSRQSHLNQHIKQVHDKIKDKICAKCDYKFCRQSDLNAHIKAVHLKIKDKICTECDAKFGRQSDLNQHIKRIHLKIQDKICEKCDYKFSSQGELNIHIKVVHLKIQDKICEKCDYKCSRQSNLNRHIKSIHLKIKDKICEKCDYKFSTQGNLDRHIKICTGKSNMSSMEFICATALDELKLEFIYDSSHDSLKGLNGGHLRFDFIIPTINESYFMIETNGRQHYAPVNFGGISQEQAEEKFRNQVLHDAVKEEYCRKNGFSLLWIHYNDMREYTAIIQEFLIENKIQV